jgi:hypothetical protein
MKKLSIISLALVLIAVHSLHAQGSVKVLRASKYTVVSLWITVANDSDQTVLIPICGEEFDTPLLCTPSLKIQALVNGKWVTPKTPPGGPAMMADIRKTHPVFSHSSGTFLLQIETESVIIDSGVQTKIFVPTMTLGDDGSVKQSICLQSNEFRFP